jgi:2-keto-4-pentenoate hydratase/2-oxohepta-3-ene-1,7-dioic acid hydratase in catechol pathway
MFIARVGIGNDRVAFGVVEGVDSQGIPAADSTVEILQSHPFGELVTTGESFPLAEVRLLPPMIPTKIIGIGKNYADHAKEMGGEVPAEPICFLKPTTSLIGTGDVIRLPWQTEHVEHEVELAVVIGRMARHVLAEEALDYVFGYTVANDVSARDIQKRDGQWTRAKGFDTFLPLGPWIATHVDPTQLGLRTLVNDEVRQDGNTADLVFDVPTLVSWCSSVMTLLPGDIILTGTPAGVSPIRDGDVVQCVVDGIGEVINTVEHAEAR